jgi:hypothetical protein
LNASSFAVCAPNGKKIICILSSFFHIFGFHSCSFHSCLLTHGLYLN